MKKVVDLLYFILLILLYHLTKNSNMLVLTVSFSMAVIFFTFFSTIDIRNTLNEYKENSYARDKIFRLSIILITIISSFILVVAYLFGIITKIDGLWLVNIFMSLSVYANVLIKVIGEYLEILGYKKIGINLNYLYHFINIFFLTIMCILLFKIFHFNNYINVIILYTVSIVVFVVILIILWFAIFRKIKKGKKNFNKINYIKNIKEIIITNNKMVMFNIIKYSYIYISIILLYYTLINKYNYSYANAGIIITNTYFYGIIVVNYIYLLIRKYLNSYMDNIYQKISSNDSTVSYDINNFIIRVIKLSLPVCILLLVISGPLNKLLFSLSYNVLFDLILLLFFYILYDITFDMSMYYIKNKNLLFILLFGFILKLVLEVPLINAIYRTGYNIVFGSILANIIGLAVSVIAIYIFIINKFKLQFLDNFNKLLNIIYENIVFCLLLVLFTLVVKVDTKGIIDSIFVIVFYIFITIVFYFLNKKLHDKS